MAKKVVKTGKLEFYLKDVVEKFGKDPNHHTLETLGYDIAHLLFDQLANSETGSDISIGELSESAYNVAEQLGKNYIIIDKREYEKSKKGKNG